MGENNTVIISHCFTFWTGDGGHQELIKYTLTSPDVDIVSPQIYSNNCFDTD